MGINGSKKGKRTDLTGSQDFEVFVQMTEEVSLKSLANSWITLQFTYDKGCWTVSKNGSRLILIKIDSSFEIISEQPDEFTFTIRFLAEEKPCWLKLRCKEREEYFKWNHFLKTSLRKTWKNSDKCQSCFKAFKVFFRKHHCRKCGECVCSDCSPIRSTLPGLGYKERVRMCLECGRQIEHSRKGVAICNTPNFRDRRVKL